MVKRRQKSQPSVGASNNRPKIAKIVKNTQEHLSKNLYTWVYIQKKYGWVGDFSISGPHIPVTSLAKCRNFQNPSKSLEFSESCVKKSFP